MIAWWQHSCLWQERCMDVSMIELSKRRTLGYFPKTWFPLMAAPKMACNCGHCSLTSTAACRRSSTAASRMSCSNGRYSSSSTAACQVMGVIDLLLWTAEYQKKKMRIGSKAKIFQFTVHWNIHTDKDEVEIKILQGSVVTKLNWLTTLLQ